MAKAGVASRKMLIAELPWCKEVADLTGDSIRKEFFLQTRSSPQNPLAYIWLQGTIVQHNNADTFILDDGTGRALITDCCKLPKVFPKPRIGGYFLVIGRVKDINKMPVVKVLKLQDLRGQEMLKEMWTLEVLDTREGLK